MIPIPGVNDGYEPEEVPFSRAVKEPEGERVLPVRDAAEFAFRAVADTLLTVLLELPNRYGDKHTIDRRIAIAAAQKMKADALRAIDSVILNNYLAAEGAISSPASQKDENDDHTRPR